jgi:murein L,D-transpeptidase YcbB/YkuD
MAAWLAAGLLAASAAWAEGPAQASALPLSLADGQAIEHALLAASEFPFPPELAGAAQALASPNEELRAAADLALTRAAINLAQEERGRLSDPAAVDPNWALRAPYDAPADFAAARAAGKVAAWAEALPRRDGTYLALISAQKRYQAIAAHGGWKMLPPHLNLARGAKGPAVLALRARLAREGYSVGAAQRPVFDGDLAAAVTEFQGRHGLAPNGTLTPATVAAMNVPIEARLGAIAASLERARWAPYAMPADRIVADIASATAVLYQAGAPTLRMRTVVGDPQHETPMFASHVSSIQFNPAWHVPADIAKAELFPKEARTPGYFARHGYEVVNGQIVQHAGPKSSLGRIKFEMPNAFSVYLHDTPGHALFAVDSRGRSHGCVRLEKPKDLAVALLASQGWDIDRVQETIDKGDTRWVKPSQVTAVFIVYRTAEAVDDGPVIFRPDIYGWDAKVDAALAAVPLR